MEQKTKTKTSKLRLGASAAGVMVGALALLSTGQAHADSYYFEPDLGGNSWVMGNDDFNTQATIIAHSWAKGETTDSGPLYETVDQDVHAAFVTVFGQSKQLISTVARGEAVSRSGKYATVEGQVNVLGSRIWTAEPKDDSACPPSAGAVAACASYDRDWSKTFFHTEKTFMVTYVPVTVKATIKGGIRAHVSTRALTMQGLPAAKRHHLGIVNLSAGAGGYASATLTALAGIEDVLAVGVTANFKLIDLSAASTSSVLHRNDNVTKLFSVNRKLGFNIKSMNGTVSVWAQISPWITPSKTLISVAGYSKWIPIEEGTTNTVLPAVDL